MNRVAAAVALALAGTFSANAATFEPWRAVAPTELSGRPATAASDLAAEVLFWNIRVDDSDYPNERVTREYIRYKIYDPEKSVNLTRISELTATSEGTEMGSVTFLARLVLPDGTIKEFGKDSIQERDVLHSGSEQNWLSHLLGASGTEVKEKFLAVTGIEPGAVLEFQFTRAEYHPQRLYVHVFQKNGVPIRHLEYVQQLADSASFIPRPFLIGGTVFHAALHNDTRKHQITVTVDDLPPLYSEPLSPPVLERSLAIAGSYVVVNDLVNTHHLQTSITINPKAGPWSNFASRMAFLEKDVTEGWPIEAQLAAKLTAGSSSELEKGRRIHQYVHELYLKYVHSPRASRPLLRKYFAAEPEQVIEFDRNLDVSLQTTDFLWLAVGLYKAAGLKAQTILLPNNTVIRFDQSMTSEVFLPDICARVLVDGQWKFSQPATRQMLPLGTLPLPNVGGVGLIAQVGKTEFIDVPMPTANDSSIVNAGAFELSAEGGLTGTCTQTLTGVPAIALKTRLEIGDDERRNRILSRNLRTEFKADAVRVTSVRGALDPDAPLVITYTIRWTNYGTVTKSRIIFVPCVFESRSQPLFPSAIRHNSLTFPNPVKVVDDFTLHAPEGYVLEAPSAPASIPGSALSITYNVSYVPVRNQILVKRTYFSTLERVDKDRYPDLRGWFDSVAKLDMHELVLLQKPAAAAAPAANPKPDASSDSAKTTQ